MSKIAFISDIHGNYSALSSVWEDIQKRNITEVYCLGDMVGYYSQINLVLDFIRENKIPCIMGNHDYAMIYDKGVIERSKTCTMVLGRQLEMITQENFNFLKSCPEFLQLNINEYSIFCTHGGLNNYVDEYLNDLDEEYLKKLPQGTTHFITAHTHLPLIKRFENIHYANTGSVGQPRDGDNRASYLIFEEGYFTLVRVSYDIDNVAQHMQENGFPSYIYEILYKGTKIGG